MSFNIKKSKDMIQQAIGIINRRYAQVGADIMMKGEGDTIYIGKEKFMIEKMEDMGEIFRVHFWNEELKEAGFIDIDKKHGEIINNRLITSEGKPKTKLVFDDLGVNINVGDKIDTLQGKAIVTEISQDEKNIKVLYLEGTNAGKVINQNARDFAVKQIAKRNLEIRNVGGREHLNLGRGNASIGKNQNINAIRQNVNDITAFDEGVAYVPGAQPAVAQVAKTETQSIVISYKVDNWYKIAKKKKNKKVQELPDPYVMDDGIMKYKYIRPDGTEALMVAEEDEDNGDLEVESKKKKKKNTKKWNPNPWSVCTKSVGRDDKEKYEKCVKQVKKKQN